MRHTFHRWPEAALPEAAERLRDRFAALGPAARRFAASVQGAHVLAALGGNSPYLSDLALREPRILRAVLLLGPDRVMASVLAALRATDPDRPRAAIAARLRQAKRQAALTIALADLGRVWRLAQVTEALTTLAEATVQLAVAHLLRAAHASGELELANPEDPAHGSGFTVLGMGKLGARELNYSSDIDLILLYDPEPHATRQDQLGRIFTRLARALVGLMETRDADGYVFRTDLRLRPDPGATPPAISLPAALTYYEAMGQTWERAAMIKARPIAGDLELGTRFLTEIRPFVWRRQLDFAAIADLHQMKQRIDAHKGCGDPNTLPGHDLKLGAGGIREVEFIAQSLQLVWGGRDPALREPRTVTALHRLCRAGHLSRRAARRLGVAYRFLRDAEHRLQMVDDRQTHRLPDTEEALDRFALFTPIPAHFTARLRRTLALVRAEYAAFFDRTPAQPDSEIDLALPQGRRADAPARLRALGYTEPDRIAAAVQSWRSGQPRALRSDRARGLLEQLLPPLLAALAAQPQPDLVFARFDAFLSHLPAGVQILSLLLRNPALLARLAGILGAAPRLADHLAQVPAAIEGLLLSSQQVEPDPATTLTNQLRDARVLEDAIDITRRFVRAEEFRLSVAVLEARLDVDRAGQGRTDLADAAICALLPFVLRAHEDRMGIVPGGALAVVALGKAGGREMLAGSDLDLMLVYDHDADATHSTGGAEIVSAGKYYIRAAHQFVAALTAPGAEGPLYAVDMRLRPSGNKGPVAVSLASFRQYHQDSAWTWERMALTRARVVAGPARLRGAIEAAIQQAMMGATPDKIRPDTLAMRRRMLRDLPASGPWDVKHRAGGLMEVEFIAQSLQLQHAARPDVLAPSTNTALRRLAAAGVLPIRDAETLIRADRIWRAVQDVLRITLADLPRGDLPGPVADTLCWVLNHKPGLQRGARNSARGQATGVDVPALMVTLDQSAADVRSLFTRLIGDPEEA